MLKTLLLVLCLLPIASPVSGQEQVKKFKPETEAALQRIDSAKTLGMSPEDRKAIAFLIEAGADENFLADIVVLDSTVEYSIVVSLANSFRERNLSLEFAK